MAGIVSFDKMKVGAKGGGKHWTKQEIEGRTKAAKRMRSGKAVATRPPIWLDDEARQVWKRTLADMAGLDLLDKLDTEALAVYCDAVARHKEASMKIRELGYTVIGSTGTEIVSPYVRAAQSYARIIISYADKLGLNPNSRARLAKKQAEEAVDPNADLFE